MERTPSLARRQPLLLKQHAHVVLPNITEVVAHAVAVSLQLGAVVEGLKEVLMRDLAIATALGLNVHILRTVDPEPVSNRLVEHDVLIDVGLRSADGKGLLPSFNPLKHIFILFFRNMFSRQPAHEALAFDKHESSLILANNKLVWPVLISRDTISFVLHNQLTH